MGLGKTVELLACIFAHHKATSEDDDTEMQVTSSLNRVKRERVECVCGAVTESYKYKGLWVQCDMCDAWQHADCVGYSSTGKPLISEEVDDGEGHGRRSAAKLQNDKRKKNTTTILEREGDYICQLCSELLQATESPVATGATLIVCPAPILPQWHAEILRYVSCTLSCICNLTLPLKVIFIFYFSGFICIRD